MKPSRHFKERWKTLLATHGAVAGEGEQTDEARNGRGGSPPISVVHFVQRNRRTLLVACLCAFSVVALIVHFMPFRASAQRRPLHGRVQLDGVSVAHGSISLLPAVGNSGPAANASIVDGEYNFTKETGPRGGPHRVLIDIYVPPGQADASAEQPIPDMKKTTSSAVQNGNAGRGPPAERTQVSTRRHWELEYAVPEKGTDRKDFELEG